MKFKGYVAALPALLLTGCAMLPGQPTDYDRFCNCLLYTSPSPRDTR